MNNIALKALAAEKQTTDQKLFRLNNRIKNEHYITDISESSSWIEFFVDNKLTGIVSNQNIIFTPVLILNIIDECICSIIYDIFKNKDNKDLLNYYNQSLEFLINRISIKLKNNKDFSKKQIQHMKICNKLVNLLNDIYYLCIPVNNKEECSEYKLAKDYYSFMYEYCVYHEKENDYFEKLKHFYFLNSWQLDQKED